MNNEAMSELEIKLCNAIEEQAQLAKYWRRQCVTLTIYVFGTSVAILLLLWKELAFFIPSIQRPAYIPWVQWIDTPQFILGVTAFVILMPACSALLWSRVK